MWYKNINDVYKELDSSEKGLITSSVNERIKKYGKNVLPKKKHDSFIKILLKSFIDPMEILLIISGLFSLYIKEYIDAGALFFIILVDVILGAFQEWKANKSQEALENLVKYRVKVLRDGKEKIIDSSELVIGDIMLLSSGDKISADARIIECSNLSVDESTLTGESLSVVKTSDVLDENIALADKKNMLFAGTNILTGRVTAIVTSTGSNTEVGIIATKVLNTEEEKTPLTIRMNKLIKQISLLIVVIAFITTIVLYIKGVPRSEIFLSVIALSVSAMPEGLGLALTMALTIASNRMSKKNVLVKKLNAVESLGSTTVIASDKTGTLTVNEQTAKKILLPDNTSFYIEGSGYNSDGKVIADANANIEDAKFISKLAVLNNEATLERIKGKYKYTGDSIDVAFLSLGLKLDIDTKKIKITNRIPYESENKYSEVTYVEDGKSYTTIKGSLEVILDHSKDMIINGKKAKLNKELILEQNEFLASDGYRVIALAYKEGHSDKDMHFVGLVAFIDPVRPGVLESIEECMEAGIKVLMITGDHPLTAYKIASDLNIASSMDQVCNGMELDKVYEKGEKKFDEFVKSKTVFTRVTPINKLQIVESLKRMGEFVAVTGDGVNDAPALKAANIGVSVGSGTDVAKETASLIILDDSFKSIVAGVKEGRSAYNNIRKVCEFLLSCGFAEVLFFIMAIICDLPMPLVAIQLLWLNLVTDGLQDISLSCEKESNDVMKEKPISPKESIFNKELFQEIMISGLTISILVFGLWAILYKSGMPTNLARGYVMALMVFIQNIHVLNCRSEKKSFLKVPLNGNYLIILTIVGSIGLQILVSEIPILSKILKIESVHPVHLVLLFCLSTIVLFVMEVYKTFKYRKK